VKIQAATKAYEVSIHNDFEPVKNISIDEKTFVVIDKTLYEIYKKELFDSIPEKQLYILEATEERKVIDTALEICEIMTEISAKRNTKLISFGGGIVQDVTGFVANILYRGIHWTFFPTTLLAGCDSCIGGKTSLNYKKFKNLLGTFYPPDSIYVCTPFFKSLSEKDFKSGLGEVVKFNVMQKEEGVANMEANLQKLLERDDEVLRRFVESSLAFKKNFIEVDEFDQGERIKLNFAHTFGHAFEAVSDYGIPHGTAVAMGTLVANYISEKRGWLSKDIVSRMEKVLLPIIPVKGSDLDFPINDILSAIHKDKKQTSSSLTAVLMQGQEMELHIVNDVTEDEIKEAIDYLYGILK